MFVNPFLFSCNQCKVEAFVVQHKLRTRYKVTADVKVFAIHQELGTKYKVAANY